MNNTIDLYLDSFNCNNFINEMFSANLMDLDLSENPFNLNESTFKNLLEIATDKNTIDKTKKAYKQNKETAKKFLQDHGVDVSKIIKKAKNIGSKINTGQKSGKTPEQVSKEISRSITKPIIAELNKVSKKIISEHEDEKESHAILRSILIFLCILYVNTLCFTILASIIDPKKAMSITAIIFCPLFEEIGKNTAIKGKYPWIYTGIFSGLELLMYVNRLVMMGANLGKVVILRLVGVLMHFATMMIQKYFIDKYGEESKAAIIGFWIAVLFHITFNILALKYNNNISAWVMS